MVNWRNRIVGYGEEDPEQLLANPYNFRVHTSEQARYLRAVLDDVGWVGAVIVNQRTGHMIDGHLRVQQAMANGSRVPVLYVDLDENEEKLALASFDFITTLAGIDESVLAEVLASAEATSDNVDEILRNVAETAGIEMPDDDEWADAFGALPDSEPTHTQMTFTLSHEQAETVKRALGVAANMGPFGDTGNENRNGNALARICEMFLGEYGGGDG